MKAAGYAGVAVIAAVPVLLVLVGGADTGCAPQAAAVGTAAIPAGDPPGTWTRVHAARARDIVTAGQAMRMPARAWVIAVATAMQESTLRNLANSNVPASLGYPHDGLGYDHDSLGVLQQRPSPPDGAGAWGTVAELMTPRLAGAKFYTALRRVSGWQGMALTDAAQAVQRSAFPDAYAKWEAPAGALVAWLVGQPDVEAIGGGGPYAPCGPDGLDTVAVSRAGWVAPVDAPISSRFGMREGVLHAGVDLAGARGDPVRAAGPGRVAVATCAPSTGNCDIDGSIRTPGCGWYVEIRHDGGVVTRYCHLVSRPRVARGQLVAAGTVLGYVGTSGNSDGPHLHFEVHTQVTTSADDSNAVDPVRFLAARGVDLR